jgi:hypothetical protein|tara:strand:+ start:913 stop:1290 length:378 start_codon:yes stop_codon:yes gene_type:complete
MFDNKLSVSLNWLSKKKRTCTIWWDNRPNGIINRIGDEAYLLVSGESSEDLRGALLGMKIEFLVIDPGISYETHLLAIFDSIISLILVDFLNMNDGSTASSHHLRCCGATVGLVIGSDLIAHIKH